MNLKARINELQQRLLPELPDETLETLQNSTEELVRSGIAEQAIGAGDTAPEFELRYSAGNGTGDSWSLSTVLEEGPAVLSFYRGGW